MNLTQKETCFFHVSAQRNSRTILKFCTPMSPLYQTSTGPEQVKQNFMSFTYFCNSKEWFQYPCVCTKLSGYNSPPYFVLGDAHLLAQEPSLAITLLPHRHSKPCVLNICPWSHTWQCSAQLLSRSGFNVLCGLSFVANTLPPVQDLKKKIFCSLNCIESVSEGNH